MTPNDDAALDRGAATKLRRLAQAHGAPRFSVADLLATLGDQGFGLLILLLALPNAVPGPFIPGFSVPFALGIAALGLQIAAGWRAPRLPSRLRRLSMQTDSFRHFVKSAEPLLLRFERWLRPRPSRLTQGTGERFVGVALVVLSFVLVLPVPFGNLPIAISIIVIALGLLEGDGYALRVGLLAGLTAVAWNGLLVAAGAQLFESLARLF